ncbi:hypothetical protein FNZ56_06525 [Pseudoluteimonas lycopersici]|uniref:Uncharacterized protein n=1 Tax=Pseudoluteimonas lycopersici TaxID=1324796 RepID=A0A516V4Y5_9GAMM|nr:hypothetical protein [Lysobacter lycopersici]QDQ73551.1 hypothetical protein FNZ56_06525 [Lysobacter lycopersici]
MSTATQRLALITLIGSIALPASASDAIRIDVHDLARDKTALLGKHVTAHGCLVINIHGEFIEPCGSSNSREITLVEIRDYKLIQKALGRLDLDSDLEGDFSGVIVEESIDWPEPGKAIFLRLESINGITLNEP